MSLALVEANVGRASVRPMLMPCRPMACSGPDGAGRPKTHTPITRLSSVFPTALAPSFAFTLFSLSLSHSLYFPG
jgi:hypothetical protein